MKCCDRGNKLFNYSLVPREDRRDSITEMEKEMFSKVIKNLLRKVRIQIGR